MNDADRGWYLKYVIAKADGSPVDPKAQYLVLRLDTDRPARDAAVTYARHCHNRRLGADILGLVAEIEGGIAALPEYMTAVAEQEGGGA